MVKRLIVAMLLVLGVGLFLPGCKGDSELRQRFRKEAIESRLDKRVNLFKKNPNSLRLPLGSACNRILFHKKFTNNSFLICISAP